MLLVRKQLGGQRGSAALVRSAPMLRSPRNGSHCHHHTWQKRCIASALLEGHKGIAVWQERQVITQQMKTRFLGGCLIL